MLLDTHVLLWLLSDHRRLGPLARVAITEAPVVLASAASFWEIAIKRDRGTIIVPDGLLTVVADSGVRHLPIDPEHSWAIQTITSLPHRDPFDRLLMAQAALEEVPFMTADHMLIDRGGASDVRIIDARI